MRRLVVLLLPLLCLLAALPETAFAHPLGNFTINRYARLEVQASVIRIRYVLDEAEIPTYQELALLHPGGTPTAAEEAQFLTTRVEQLRANLHLVVNGQPSAIALEPGSAALSFPPGQGGLTLLRVTAWYRADVSAPPSDEARRVSFVDDNYDDRLGWKEMIVRGVDGVAIQQSTVTAVDQSDELRSYPQDMLSSPLDVRSAQFSFTLATTSSATSGGDAVGVPSGSLLQPRGKSSGLVTDATQAFTSLIGRQAPSLPFILFALVAAMVLGGIHALSPGHGKTIVGAYLVGSRGTGRHAALLGLTVTITHTAGVFALGFVTLFAARTVTPERLYPWLSAGSGLLVAVLGGWLLFVRLRAATRPERRAYAAASSHGHARGDAGTHRHDHRPEHHVHTPGGHVLTHTHDGVAHQHVLPTEQLTPRGLIALGISGGLLPCPSALVVLLAAISLQQVAFGIILVLAFSVGLAGVLTMIGLLLVYARGAFARVRFTGGVGRLLPAASAAVVLALGLVMSVQAVAQIGLLV